MSKDKPRLAEELESVNFQKPGIGNWLSKLPIETQHELNELHACYHAGRYAGNAKQVSQWIKDRCNLSLDVETISRWLRGKK